MQPVNRNNTHVADPDALDEAIALIERARKAFGAQLSSGLERMESGYYGNESTSKYVAPMMDTYMKAVEAEQDLKDRRAGIFRKGP